jgi:hypothetical protein
MSISLDALVQQFRTPKPKAEFRGRREEQARELSRNAMYAIHHPGLCATMPHRLFPVRESDEMCIRCGLFVGRP